MAHKYNTGYVVVDTDPNSIVSLQSNHLIKIAILENGNQVWRFIDSNAIGNKWVDMYSLNVVKQPIYEYRDIWAEEGGGTNANNAEWSFGNGAVGFMGLPIDDGWEVEAMYFHADTYAATATIQVDLMNYGNTPSNAAANTISSITLNNSTDGGGATNNAYKYEVLSTPINIIVNGTSTVIGFITRAETGNISDARVGARLRRKIGDFVSNVSIV